MKKYVLVVAVAAALFSCSGNPKADATQTDKNKQETAQVPDMHNAETSLDYWGVYEGTLPAASSPGIKTTLNLGKVVACNLHNGINRFLTCDHDPNLAPAFVTDLFHQ